jgi:hypothetical protein
MDTILKNHHPHVVIGAIGIYKMLLVTQSIISRLKRLKNILKSMTIIPAREAQVVGLTKIPIAQKRAIIIRITKGVIIRICL